MNTFYEYWVKGDEGIQEAKGKWFVVEYEEVNAVLGEFSHISEYYLAVFKNGSKETRTPILLDGKENPELKHIFVKN